MFLLLRMNIILYWLRSAIIELILEISEHLQAPLPAMTGKKSEFDMTEDMANKIRIFRKLSLTIFNLLKLTIKEVLYFKQMLVYWGLVQF